MKRSDYPLSSPPPRRGGVPQQPFSATSLRYVTFALYLALIALIAAWEAKYAPAGIVPRPAWLAIKLTPLLALGYGLWRGGPRAHVIAALVALLYFIEGVVLGFGGAKGLESPATAWYALAETALALGFFVCASLYARVTARAADRSASAETVS